MANKRRTELNEREVAVFIYLGEGKRDVDIAAFIDVQPRMVAQVVYRALRIIGAETRCHAVKLLCERGFYNKGPT